ncbi:MAG: DUF4199 domain-containing protein [Vicinamibacterales bacterium]
MSLKTRIVLTFGGLSGLVSAGLMFATLPFMDRIGFDRGAIVGYTGMVLSFLFVFFGVRAYRDQLDGAPLSFGRAFGVGLLITLISCVFYVVAWEIVYFNFMPDFVEQYSAHVLDQLRASGATEAAIDAQARQMADFKAMYDNPFFNMAITFIEPFPVGLLMTLVSAVVLRRRAAA